ncbi:MAG: carbamate kinase [Xanthomonadales bacterium]|nr:carbamate kinase [Xanthomonadales bacterium]
MPEPTDRSQAPLVVIAIGGNSLIKDNQHTTVLDQYMAVGETASHIVPIIREGYRVVITHGNGPQVGFILLRSDLARNVLHEVPLASCVADTQGAIGFQITQTLLNELHAQDMQKEVVAVVTQVVVDADDPAFANPDKPIGPFMSEPEARQRATQNGWTVGEDAGRGWRRMVPAPAPLQIIELNAIRALLENDMLVVAVGGGGIPVARRADGRLKDVEAVIDKDAASCILACELDAKVMIQSTSVDKVALHYGTPRQVEIDHMTVAEARRYLEEGHFAPGSMRPKIKAAITFLEQGGERVIITQPHHLEQALHGIYGTHIVPSRN